MWSINCLSAGGEVAAEIPETSEQAPHDACALPSPEKRVCSESDWRFQELQSPEQVTSTEFQYILRALYVTKINLCSSHGSPKS